PAPAGPTFVTPRGFTPPGGMRFKLGVSWGVTVACPAAPFDGADAGELPGAVVVPIAVGGFFAPRGGGLSGDPAGSDEPAAAGLPTAGVGAGMMRLPFGPSGEPS